MSVFRVLAVVLAVVVAVGVGTAVYNAGVTAGLAEAARQAVANGDPATVVPGGYYGWGHYGPGYGFGFFGVIFWILGVFLVIGLLRAALGRGRWGGPGGGPGRREGVEAWHRELHRRDGGHGQPSPSGG